MSVHSVLTDDFKGGALAAEHLLGRGHRRIAVLSENFKVTSSFERVRGFRFALFEAGIALDEADIISCDSSIRDGKRAAAALIRGENRPSAIFCCNDLLAIGALASRQGSGGTGTGAAVDYRL